MYITYRILLEQFSVYYCVIYNFIIFLIHIFGVSLRYFNWYIISFDRSTHVDKFLYREPGIPDRVFNPTTRTLTGGVS